MIRNWIMFMLGRFVALIMLAGMMTACTQTAAVSSVSWDNSYTATANNVPNMGPSAGIF